VVEKYDVCKGQKTVLTQTVKDIEQIVRQPDRLLTIKENATVAEAARKMSDNQVGCLVVFDMQNKFTGVLTERDILSKVTTTYSPPHNLLVREIMTASPISCTMETTIEKVEQLMAEHQIRHVPIVADGVPIGMVSSRDVIAYQLRSNKAMKSAAEQLAMLSTELKSLNLEDVITLAVDEVPKSFGAGRAVLCFDQKASSDPVIYRRNCSISRKSLLDPAEKMELLQNGQIIHGQICNECRKVGGQAPRLVIPLDIHDQLKSAGDDNVNRQNFLCMCCFKPSSIELEKLRLYKATLLQEILSVNLTNAKLYHNYQKARHDSEVDPLTGVGTRRVLEEALKTEYSRALRYNHCFSVAIVDLDNLKEINDGAGHAAGDRMLQKLAKIMRENVRMTDVIIARYGGDEFVLLMPETKLNNAKITLERLRRQVEGASISGTMSMTISCGVAEWSGSVDETVEEILRRADTALYEAKRTGRNRVVASEPAENKI
jgi:diguanylate cyclase (GGDEF)-like protein